jgi:cytoskeleton protein RodZ
VQAVPETLGAVGARLAQLRQAKGWSVEDVSARLKVAVPKLRELEAGDISHLPDATFAMGVVRAYAKLLGAVNAARRSRICRCRLRRAPTCRAAVCRSR